MRRIQDPLASCSVQAVKPQWDRERFIRTLKLCRQADVFLSDYNFWVSVIVKDDLEEVKEVFRHLSNREQSYLLNGELEIKDGTFFENLPNMKNKLAMFPWERKRLKKLFPVGLSRSLLIAVFTRSINVVEWLIQSGANPFMRDRGGNNILHTCALSAAVFPEHEESYRAIYKLVCRLVPQDIPELLMSENEDQLRPLELSAKAATLGIFEDILNTENVYKFTKEQQGLNVITWYDVTDYFGFGSKNRMRTSPLEMLRRLTYDQLQNSSVSTVLRSPPFSTWIRAKISQLFGLFIIWILARSIYMALFMSLVWDYFLESFSGHSASNMQRIDNSSSNCSVDMQRLGYFLNRQGIFILATIAVSMRFIVFIYSFIMDHFSCTTFTKVVSNDACHSGVRVTDDTFYTVIDFLHIVSGMSCVIIVQVDYAHGLNRFTLFAYLALATAAITNTWSIMYFLRTFPVIGSFIIIFQEMFRTMINFILVFVLIYISFAFSFYLILGTRCINMNFGSLEDSMYSTFLLMLSMVDVAENLNMHSPEGAVVVIMHISYTLIVTTMLLNFLIAVMTNVVSEMSSNEELAILLNRLSVIRSLERLQISRLLGLLHGRHRVPGLVKENNKLYISCSFLISEIQN